MKGDFSRVRYAPYDNFNGILPQQGKVLLDSDGIAQTLIENNWHETAARDVMGRVAAVPSAIANSFAISAASLSGGIVTLTVGTGHIWADGLLVRLASESGNTVNRTATWLEPPLVPVGGSAADVAADIKDAVVLEVWQHAVNGYEMPETLIEPALGGPDTAERLQTAFAFRLARLNAGQSCADLKFDESNRGALTVSLVPPVVTTGDCPVEGLQGYSGFEHRLYRVEVADTNGGGAQFKWSRTNGGRSLHRDMQSVGYPLYRRSAWCFRALRRTMDFARRRSGYGRAPPDEGDDSCDRTAGFRPDEMGGALC